MRKSNEVLWQRFQKYYTEFPTLGLALDLSRMDFQDALFANMASRLKRAFEDMAALAKGGIAHPDEGRMVGHYWLRNPALAPTAAIRQEIERTLAAMQAFAWEIPAANR